MSNIFQCNLILQKKLISWRSHDEYRQSPCLSSRVWLAPQADPNIILNVATVGADPYIILNVATVRADPNIILNVATVGADPNIILNVAADKRSP